VVPTALHRVRVCVLWTPKNEFELSLKRGHEPYWSDSDISILTRAIFEKYYSAISKRRSLFMCVCLCVYVCVIFLECVRLRVTLCMFACLYVPVCQCVHVVACIAWVYMWVHESWWQGQLGLGGGQGQQKSHLLFVWPLTKLFFRQPRSLKTNK